MADDKGLDLTSVFGDVIKQVTEAVSPTSMLSPYATVYSDGSSI